MLGGYAVRVYDVPVTAPLPERLLSAAKARLPAAYRRGRLFFGYGAGVIVLWEGGGLDFVTAEWVSAFVVLEDD